MRFNCSIVINSIRNKWQKFQYTNSILPLTHLVATKTPPFATTNPNKLPSHSR